VSAAETVSTTYGLIDVPSRKLLIVDAEAIDAETLERLAGVGVVALVAGPIARVAAEVVVDGDDTVLADDSIVHGDCTTLTIDVLRLDDAT